MLVEGCGTCLNQWGNSKVLRTSYVTFSPSLSTQNAIVQNEKPRTIWLQQVPFYLRFSRASRTIARVVGGYVLVIVQRTRCAALAIEVVKQDAVKQCGVDSRLAPTRNKVHLPRPLQPRPQWCGTTIVVISRPDFLAELALMVVGCIPFSLSPALQTLSYYLF